MKFWLIYAMIGFGVSASASSHLSEDHKGYAALFGAIWPVFAAYYVAEYANHAYKP